MIAYSIQELETEYLGIRVRLVCLSVHLSVGLSVSYLVYLKLAKTGGCDVIVIPTHACVRCQPERQPSLVPVSKSEVLIAAHNGWVQLKD